MATMRNLEVLSNEFITQWKPIVIKGKAVPQHTYGGAGGERMYSSYSFTTSALDEGEWSASRPEAKDPRYPLYRRLVGPQSRSGHRG
jgi:hypothetical protein